MKRLSLLFVVFMLSQLPALSEVKPSVMFRNNAVLQQGTLVPVWGKAKDGENVTVSFQDQHLQTVTEGGRWMVRLQPLKAGGPFEMTISGENTIRIKNVLVGEVWVCGGQSNMDFALSRSENAEQVAKGAKDYSLRYMEVPKWSSDVRADDFQSVWQVCRPDSVMNMSSVAYYFARDLRKALRVPVGIIQTGLGGTRSEWWTGKPAQQANPAFYEMLEADAKDPHRGHEHPAALYNTMIAPLQPYAIRGVIWYQGESNERDAYRYRVAFPTLIKSWREDWGQGDFPFLFVQIAPYKKISDVPEDSDWAVVRESQLLTTKSVPNTAMAVITDCGDQWDIHPKKKEPAGDRLALCARALAYGEKVVYCGPIYRSMEIRGGEIVLSFDHVHGGLVSREGELTGFAIAGSDRKFVWADARITGDKVVVHNSEVKEPKAVRFGWANYPVVNLYNREGLPASPFRTDDWPVITQPETTR